MHAFLWSLVVGAVLTYSKQSLHTIVIDSCKLFGGRTPLKYLTVVKGILEEDSAFVAGHCGSC